ncbi:uncharacterized protein SAPINGB_P006047 [Magnusiomyces paraingens]|uniref:Major facilitator superfamily (MFS) profile domain-containing protein n=1 Tax=Magnusiomyces paraingens TaxID=2606893 RepID=A0A5E8C505_9ASCO|nr:uncharacterized protein SAPINGB_P006047 [Saprochaete ingens]VVT58120.1 unnamed protein product [Saprochaete ingens]
MAPDLIRDSVAGNLINWLSNGKLLPYPEQRPDFVVPDKYLTDPPQVLQEKLASLSPTASLEQPSPALFTTRSQESPSISSSSLRKEEEESPRVYEAVDEERDLGILPQKSLDPLAQPDDSRSIDHGQFIVVDWYDLNDPDNPQNWSKLKKCWIIFGIAFLTVCMYMGSSIYVSGAPEMMKELNTTRVMVTLPLTTFIIGYGVAPMVLSPLSEHPPMGRTLLYILSVAFFCVIQVPTALGNTIEKIIGLRLLAGMAASPSLSTGGATIGDIVSFDHLPAALVFWAAGALGGPALGPFIGSLFVVKVDWRWTFWFLCIISGFLLLVISFLLPETNHATILHRRAQRLRNLTGNQAIRSPYEVQEKQPFWEFIKETLWRPIFIAFFEPIVLALNIYIAFIYIILNSWFESLPIVFNEFYHFTTIEGGLVYIAVLVGGYLGGICYLFFINRIIKSEHPAIEKFLIPAMVGSFFLPTALFIFSWGSSSHSHWIAPVISIAIFTFGALFIFQSTFAYLGRGFYRFLASVFAGNCLMRSVFASIFPIFTPPMYNNLAIKDYPVAWGGTIWACIGVIMIAIPFTIYHFGVQLRGRSKYAN